MKKYILTAVMLVSAIICASADNYSLQVNFKDGNSLEFAFAERPVMTFNKDNMKITEAGMKSYTYIVNDVLDMKINRLTDGISGVKGANTTPTFSINGGVLTGKGAKPGSKATVYDAAGVLAATATVDETGTFSVAIDHLPKGVYVVGAAGVQFKFLK